MIISPFATKLTRMIQTGQKSPERDMTNRKALEEPYRRDRWLKRNAQKSGG